MPLILTLILAAVRTALTTPAVGRHRRPRRHQRAAATLRFVIGLPASDEPHHAAHGPRAAHAVA